ncbi:hypothetical protein C5167_037799 [Papaver somniferum]|uniref:Uncharacterized protein n=1 Tax=Papaver somniferum TaxID=3469 RepID=A0A4Y7IBS4_PAPSO|nr:hypothetical protein C5167_037799 [Papaver somniferum]
MLKSLLNHLQTAEIDETVDVRHVALQPEQGKNQATIKIGSD